MFSLAKLMGLDLESADLNFELYRIEGTNVVVAGSCLRAMGPTVSLQVSSSLRPLRIT